MLRSHCHHTSPTYNISYEISNSPRLPLRARQQTSAELRFCTTVLPEPSGQTPLDFDSLLISATSLADFYDLGQLTLEQSMYLLTARLCCQKVHRILSGGLAQL